MPMRVFRIAPVLPLIVLLSACATSSGDTRSSGAPEGQHFTAEDIQRTGATNAWEAVRSLASHIRFQENVAGRPERVTRRGRQSVLLREDPLLVVDGALSEFRVLAQLPARDLYAIRVLTGPQATIRYGTHAAAGAIIIETLRRTAESTTPS